jgi:hypothetical protein
MFVFVCMNLKCFWTKNLMFVFVNLERHVCVNIRAVCMLNSVCEIFYLFKTVVSSCFEQLFASVQTMTPPHMAPYLAPRRHGPWRRPVWRFGRRRYAVEVNAVDRGVKEMWTPIFHILILMYELIYSCISGVSSNKNTINECKSGWILWILAWNQIDTKLKRNPLLLEHYIRYSVWTPIHNTRDFNANA